MRTGCHNVCSLSVSVSVCVTFVVFTYCESCTTPISTNPGSMEAGEYCLTRVTCFLACRLELDAVAGLVWVSWCVLGGGSGFFCVCVCFFFRFFSFERTRPAASMKPLLASMTSLLVYTILRSSLNSSSRYQGCVFTRVFIHVPGIFLHFILICFSPSWRLTPLWHLLPLW